MVKEEARCELALVFQVTGYVILKKSSAELYLQDYQKLVGHFNKGSFKCNLVTKRIVVLPISSFQCMQQNQSKKLDPL
jgi:hypothetical protein